MNGWMTNESTLQMHVIFCVLRTQHQGMFMKKGKKKEYVQVCDGTYYRAKYI